MIDLQSAGKELPQNSKNKMTQEDQDKSRDPELLGHPIRTYLVLAKSYFQEGEGENNRPGTKEFFDLLKSLFFRET